MNEILPISPFLFVFVARYICPIFCPIQPLSVSVRCLTSECPKQNYEPLLFPCASIAISYYLHDRFALWFRQPSLEFATFLVPFPHFFDLIFSSLFLSVSSFCFDFAIFFSVALRGFVVSWKPRRFAITEISFGRRRQACGVFGRLP